MEKVRPGTGRETGLGHAGVRAPKVGALGDAWSNCRKNAEFKYPLINFITAIPANAGIKGNHATG